MHTHQLKLAMLISLALAGCKAKNQASTVKQQTPFGGSEFIDLTRYQDADEKVYEKMRQEMDSNTFGYKSLRSAIDAKSTVIPKNVGRDELVAIRLYTGSEYGALNSALRTQDPSTLTKYKSIILAASSGLNKLPAQKCVAKRGMSSLPQHILDGLEKGTRFVECAFMSTTYGNYPFDGNIQFEIESDRCPKIDVYSKFDNEKEVLFPPGSEFYVTDKIVTGKKYVFKMKHIMSDDPLVSQTVRKVDCKYAGDDASKPSAPGAPVAVLTGGKPGSPGTAGYTPVEMSTFIQKRYVSKTGATYLQFMSNTDVIVKVGSGPKAMCEISSYKSNVFTIVCPDSGTHTVFGISAELIAIMKGPGSDQVTEYLDLSKGTTTPTPSVPQVPNPVPQPNPQPTPQASPA